MNCPIYEEFLKEELAEEQMQNLEKKNFKIVYPEHGKKEVIKRVWQARTEIGIGYAILKVLLILITK